MLDKGVMPPGLPESPDLIALLLLDYLRALPEPLLPASDEALFSALASSAADAEHALGALDVAVRALLHRICVLCEELCVSGACSLSVLAVLFAKALCHSSTRFNEVALLFMSGRTLLAGGLPDKLCTVDVFRKDSVLDYTNKKFARLNALKERSLQHAVIKVGQCSSHFVCGVSVLISPQEGMLRMRGREKPGWRSTFVRVHDQALSISRVTDDGSHALLCSVLLTKCACEASDTGDYAFKVSLQSRCLAPLTLARQVTPKLTMDYFVFAASNESEKRNWMSAIQSASVSK